MFNVLKKFKKGKESDQEAKTEEDYKKNENRKGEAVKEGDKHKERMAREITIHTMPKKFLLGSANVNRAKMVGTIIISVGAIFIIAAFILAYYYFFKPPEDNTQATTEQAREKEDSQEKTDIPPLSKEEEGEIRFLGGLEPETATTTDIPAVSEPAKEEPKATPKATSTPPSSDVISDSDQDGLTDREENILGCDINNIDSDGDGYNDQEEVLNLYNPAGNNKLISNFNIGEYRNTTFGYSIFYPVNWTKNVIGGDDSVMFKSPDNHFIQIVVQPNPDRLSIEDWYKQQLGAENIDQKNIVIINDQQIIKSNDGLFFYLTDNAQEYIFVLSYIPRMDNALAYSNIFEMMVRSLKVGN